MKLIFTFSFYNKKLLAQLNSLYTKSQCLPNSLRTKKTLLNYKKD
ncbi:hypothetical protein B711_0341 [Chlamydia psittaci CP3]|nr:hypothetical protein B595_0337 [Chlamydia psittaci 84/55]AFS22501.1 hypothetical protein B600_0338 [Chlamydia psittaci VS225]AFS24171.1 hypothetical protein B601_0318 [Chlamydia psittaci WS/RT/E30]AFS25960.1 hypothetical protein B603_0323 [Chlamydia psittaci WC]AFS26746.1 hypothetical protein B711_0341 [Chlamydia psittaci CP3]